MQHSFALLSVSFGVTFLYFSEYERKAKWGHLQRFCSRAFSPLPVWEVERRLLKWSEATAAHKGMKDVSSKPPLYCQMTVL